MNFRDMPLVQLPGVDEDYVNADSWGSALGEQFPGQDGHQLAIACYHNDYGPAASLRIVDLKLEQQGERDGDHWIWRVRFEDGSEWRVTGWCDYTGWDCRSNLEWICPDEAR